MDESTSALKTCVCCGYARSIRLFHKNRSKISGFDCHCKICVSKKKQKHRRLCAREPKRLSDFDIQFDHEPDALSFAEAFRVLIGD